MCSHWKSQLTCVWAFKKTFLACATCKYSVLGVYLARSLWLWEVFPWIKHSKSVHKSINQVMSSAHCMIRHVLIMKFLCAVSAHDKITFNVNPVFALVVFLGCIRLLKLDFSDQNAWALGLCTAQLFIQPQHGPGTKALATFTSSFQTDHSWAAGQSSVLDQLCCGLSLGAGPWTVHINGHMRHSCNCASPDCGPGLIYILSPTVTHKYSVLLLEETSAPGWKKDPVQPGDWTNNLLVVKPQHSLLLYRSTRISSY